MSINAGGMIVLATVLCAATADAAPPQRPNVLVFFIDDMGYADPGCFGNPLVKTPRIDQLASEGIKLTQFYVNSPICSASRAALSTGQYPQRHRINSFLNSRRDNRRRKMADYLSTEAIHTAQVFKSAGYRTAHFGKWHLGGGRDVDDAPLPTAYGFDASYVSFEGLGDRVLFNNHKLSERSAALGQGRITHAPKHQTTRIYVDKAIDFISSNPDKPFYLQVFPNDVHDPFLPAKGQAKTYAEITENPEEQKFLAVLTEMDRQIGRLLDHLEEAGLARNTIVVFTSDNGPTDWPRYYKAGIDPPGFTGPFFGRKWSLFEGGIRMPFIIRWPGHVPAGREDNKSVVAAIDMQLSLAKLAGIPVPKDKRYDGEDRSHVFLGQPTARKTALFWEYGVLGSIKPGKREHRSPTLALRDGLWKYLANPDGSRAMLFDLAADPGERNNLAAKHPQRAAEMAKRLSAWWDEMKQYFK